MPIFLTLLLLILSASPLGAQAPSGEETVREITVPAEPASPSTAPQPEPAVLQERSAQAEGAADPVLDAGFWRSVLAGVIVAVVSTLILRLIL